MMALASPDPTIRNPAEEMVTRAKEADLAGFLIALIGELRDETKSSVSRQMAGVVLKNSVALNLREVEAREALEKKWIALPANVRLQVKTEALSTLGSASREVRSIAALIIGNLSRIELPHGEWPQLIETLVSATSSGSDQHTEAALTALGYICEEASEYEAVEEYLAQFSTPILQAVGAGMNSANEDVKYYATNALCNSMEFIHGNMEQKEQRDYLVQIVCDAATTCRSDRTREKAMECLVKVADLYYNTLPSYIVQLHQITTNAVFNDSEAVALQAMLFWVTICDNERDMLGSDDAASCLNYAQTGASQLCDLCFKCLVRQEEGQTEDDWNLSIAAGKLMQSLAECIGNNIVALTMPFVYANINSTNWRECEAALMTFGCILAGPDPKLIEDTVAQAVPGLLSYIRHQNEMIADTCGWVLATVCEIFPDLFLDVATNLQQLLNIVGPMITSGSGIRSIRAVHIVHNLALAYEDEEDQNSNELTPFYQDIVMALLGAIDSADSDRLRATAQEALSVVVDAAAADCFGVLRTLVPELHKRLQHFITLRAHGGNKEETEHMQDLICGAINGVAKKLGLGFRDFVDGTVALLLQVFAQFTDTVQEEALITIGSLAQAVGMEFAVHLPTLMPYVLLALQQVDQEDLCHAAVGVIGDCAGGLAAGFVPYAETPLTSIRDLLLSSTVDRDVKCSLLGCLGDIALNIGGENYLPYLQTFMQIVQTMYAQSKAINFKGDYDSEEYVMGLWEAICGFYTGVCQAYNGQVSYILPHLQEILTFALEVARAGQQYEDVFAAAIGVLGDLANVLSTAEPSIRQGGKNSLGTAQVRQVISEGYRSKCEEVKEQAQWAGTQLEKLQAA